MQKITALFTALLLAAFFQVQAQISSPAPSPQSTVTQKVGLSDISITYSRPGVKGRKIFGELEPYGEVWRTGANALPKLTLSDDVTFGGKPVPAGEYALLTIPDKSEWTVILSRKLDGGEADYDEAQDVARAKVKPVKLSDKVETFTIGFSDFTNDGANMNIMWENTKVSVPIKVEVDKKVMAQIEKTMASANASANDYYQAASYYFTTDRDPKKAMEWINKAVSMNDTQFWVLHLQAKILEKNGKNAEAKAAAEKSIKLAKEAGNDDYVRMNEALIAGLK
jgi:tetratricopeptide (TPR) repeat protein